MTDKHTSGPWTIYPHPNASCNAICVGAQYSNFSHSFATVYLNPEANARLIAAAPLLLSACRVAETKLMIAGDKKTASVVKSAIEKATGDKQRADFAQEINHDKDTRY